MQRDVKNYSRKNNVAYIVLILLAAGSLVSLLMSGLMTSIEKGLWHDEALSLFFVSLSWSELNTLISSYEFNMAAYYYALKSWTTLSTDEGLVRGLSLIFFFLAVSTTAYAVYVASNAKGALITIIFLMAHFFLARYSAEIRGYSLTMLVLAVLWLSWFQYFSNHVKAYWLAIYTIAGALAAYAHLFSVLGVGVMAVLGLLHIKDTKRLRSWILCHLIIGLAWLPLLLLIISKEQGQLEWIGDVTFRAIIDTLFTYAGAAPQGSDLIRRILLLFFLLSSFIITTSFFATFYFQGFSRFFSKNNLSDKAAFYLLIISLTPIVIVYCISQIKPVFSERFFVFFIPFF